MRIILLALLIVTSAGVVRAEPLHLQAVVYPPLVYAEGDRLWGIGPEAVAEIQRRTGDASAQEATPWLRAYEQTKLGPRRAMFAVVRIPAREKLFKWVGPVFGEGDYFFKRADSDIDIHSLEDARNVTRIAVRKGGYTHQALEAEGFGNLDVGPSYDASYLKLDSGRVDLVLMGELTYRYMVQQAGLKPERFQRTAVKFGDSAAWIAFSRDVPDALVERWQRALDEMKADGTFDRILQRNFGR